MGVLTNMAQLALRQISDTAYYIAEAIASKGYNVESSDDVKVLGIIAAKLEIVKTLVDKHVAGPVADTLEPQEKGPDNVQEH
jgi:hypothetical protein